MPLDTRDSPCDDVLFYGVPAGQPVGHRWYAPHTRAPVPSEFAKNYDACWCFPTRRENSDLNALQVLQQQGRVHLHHAHGWTIVAWWDRSGDLRPNSNAAFFVRGEHDYDTAMAKARASFPREFARMEAVYCFAPAAG